jgi:energy-coupling factor transporter transmembrane protein EcfT
MQREGSRAYSNCPYAGYDLAFAEMNEASTNQRSLLVLVCAHVLLVATFGQYYAKISVPVGLPIFVTEAVVVVLSVLGWRLITSPIRDPISLCVLIFLANGVFWVVVDGVGDMKGAGVKALSFFVYSVLFFVVRSTATDVGAQSKVLRTLCFASVAGAVLGLLQMRLQIPLFGAIEGFESGFEETSTGSIRWVPGEYALYGTFAAIIVIVRSTVHRRITRVDAVVLAAAAAEIILAQHRSGFVALVLALGFTALVLIGSARALVGLLKVGAVIIGGLLIFVFVFGGTYLDDTINRIAHTSDANDVNIDFRLLSWLEVFEGVKDNPIGHGFSRWDFLFLENPLTGSHNSLLDLSYRIGVQGLVVFLAIPTMLLRRTRALVQATSPQEHLIAITVCACMIAFLVFATFNVVLETPHLSILFWILLGLGTAAVHPRPAQK